MNNKSITTMDHVGTPLDKLIVFPREDSTLSSFPTGFFYIDKSGGIPNKSLSVIAGRPAMGSTTFALNMARNMALIFNIPVAFISPVHDDIELANRVMLSLENEVGKEIEKYGDFYKLSSLLVERHPPLYFDKYIFRTFKDFKEYCHKLISIRNIKVLFLDSLELLFPSISTLDGLSYNHILQEIMQETHLTIVATSSLTRAVEYRGGCKIPMLSDLRFGLEISAKRVFAIYRPEYYGIYEDESGSLQGIAQIICLKGGNNITRMRFKPVYSSFIQTMDETDYYIENSLKRSLLSKETVDGKDYIKTIVKMGIYDNLKPEMSLMDYAQWGTNQQSALKMCEENPNLENLYNNIFYDDTLPF